MFLINLRDLPLLVFRVLERLLSTKQDATAYHTDGERASSGPQLASHFISGCAIGMLCRAHSQRSCPFASSISIGKDLMRSLICLVAVPTSNNHNPCPPYCPMHILPLHHPLSNGKAQWPAQCPRESRGWSSEISPFLLLLPITHYPLPITHHPSPVTRHPSPITHHHPSSVLSHSGPSWPLRSHPIPFYPIPSFQTLYPSPCHYSKIIGDLV
jgi:hypothetical protein